MWDETAAVRKWIKRNDRRVICIVSLRPDCITLAELIAARPRKTFRKHPFKEKNSSKRISQFWEHVEVFLDLQAGLSSGHQKRQLHNKHFKKPCFIRKRTIAESLKNLIQYS